MLIMKNYKISVRYYFFWNLNEFAVVSGTKLTMEYSLGIIPIFPIKLDTLNSCTETIQNNTVNIIRGDRFVYLNSMIK